MFLIIGDQIEWVVSTLIIIRMIVVLTTTSFLYLLTFKENRILSLLKNYWLFMSLYSVVQIIYLLTEILYLKYFLVIILGLVGFMLVKIIKSIKQTNKSLVFYLILFYLYVPVMIIGIIMDNNYIYFLGFPLYGFLQIYLAYSIFKSSDRSTLGKNIIAVSFLIYGFANISYYINLFFPEYSIFAYTLAIVMTISIAFSSILIAYETEMLLRERVECLQYPLFEKVSDFFLRIKDDEIIYISKSANNIFNKPVNYIEDLRLFFNENDFLKFLEIIGKTRKTDKMETFNILINKNENERWFRVNAFNYGLENKITEVLFKDIQEEISGALRIKMEKNELERKTKNQAEIFSKISHELKTPITIVMGYAETIESISEDKQIKNMANKIVEASEYQKELVNDVLDFSRLKSKLFKLNIDKINIPILIYEIMEQFKILAQKKGIDLEQEFFDLPEYFYTDRLKLHRILVNLLDNAIKYTDKGRVKLIIRKESDKHLLFIIEDTGPGIEQENIKKIFKKFVQINKKEETKGTGLGLAITKELVELLKGKIKVESEVGKGTKFIFTIENLKNK